MPLNRPPSIVVIGGTGATGREIVAALRATLPDAKVTAAARRPAPDIETVVLDVETPSAEARRELKRFDLALVALGPFHIIRERAHHLCIESSLDCVDIVDCPHAARDILALDPIARESGARVLTGMGLNPGLSTLLLDLLIDATQSRAESVSVRLFAGGNEPAGYAATRMMLHQFGPTVEEYRDGEARVVEADDREDNATYQFPGINGRVPAIHCTSAEPTLLAAARNAATLPKRIDYRIHFQGMTAAVASMLRRSSSWRGERTTSGLARVFLALHSMSRSKAGNFSSSMMVVDDGRTKAWAHGRSVFGLTAGFASVVAAHLLHSREDIPPGVHAMSPGVISSEAARSALASAGIHIEVL